MLTQTSPTTDLRKFRNSLGQFATGVTVVTAMGPDGPVGITANSFASVSLEPPLILWSPAKASKRFEIFSAASDFAIHVLRSDQEHVCHGFAQSWSPFDTLALNLSVTDADLPVFENCLARFECKTEARHDAGDHVIIVGRVLQFASGHGAPLIFHSGQYGDFLAKG